MEENKKKNLMRQIIRFAFVGGSAFVIDYGVMIFLTELIGINYLISSGISFSVSVIYNYILSVHWVFDVAEDRSKRAEFVTDRNQLSDFQRNFIFGFGYLQLYFECTLGI